MSPTPDAVDAIARHRLVPVVVIDDASRAAALGGTLTAAGLPLAEVTLRTPAALGAVRELAAVPGMLVGVGSVRDPTQVAPAVAAGAAFLVSPGLSATVVAAARGAGIPIIPGVATATELMEALALGLTTVKFFPAEASGGRRAIDALFGPFPEARFVATGGVNEENYLEYLSHPSVVAVGGSWMVPPTALDDRAEERIAELVTAARRRPGKVVA